MDLSLAILIGHVRSGTQFSINPLTGLPAAGPDFTAARIQALGVKSPTCHNLSNVVLDVLRAREVSVTHHKSRCDRELFGSRFTFMTEKAVHMITI